MLRPWTNEWIAAEIERRASWSVGNPREAAALPVITQAMEDQLSEVDPTLDGGFAYYPCEVRLPSNEWLDRVYVQEAYSYVIQWGAWPWEGRNDFGLAFEDVAEIRESRSRIPVALANKMLNEGETGMGYCAFTLVLADVRRIPYVTGNAIDWVELPDGVRPSDVVDLIPHEGRDDPSARHGVAHQVSLYRRHDLILSLD